VVGARHMDQARCSDISAGSIRDASTARRSRCAASGGAAAASDSDTPCRETG
jgi:hypothetical protein